MKKPRSDSKLKNLPREIQASIITQMTVASKGTDTSIESVIAWIKAECDIETSAGALSDFWSWYHLRSRLEAREQQSLDIQQVLENPKYGLTPEEVINLGNRYFLEQGLASGDAKLFTAVLDRVLTKRDGETRAKQNERKLSIQERRVVLLEKKAAEYDKIERATRNKSSAEMTDDERAAVLRVVDESLGLKPKS